MMSVHRATESQIVMGVAVVIGLGVAVVIVMGVAVVIGMGVVNQTVVV